MRMEVNSAAHFLVQLLRIKQKNGLSDLQLNLFKMSIADVLCRRYEEHWFPEKPTRGSGYRCIRINKAMDPVLAQAGLNIGLPTECLSRLFPSELTLWIDPAEVSYRIGEDGSICVLYEEGKSPQPPAIQAPEPLPIPNPSGNNTKAGCKEAMLILDPHNTSYSFEQTTYVSG